MLHYICMLLSLAWCVWVGMVFYKLASVLFSGPMILLSWLVLLVAVFQALHPQQVSDQHLNSTLFFKPYSICTWTFLLWLLFIMSHLLVMLQILLGYNAMRTSFFFFLCQSSQCDCSRNHWDRNKLWKIVCCLSTSYFVRFCCVPDKVNTVSSSIY